MISLVETGMVGTVICKDMSRFGRDYLQVGIYTEKLRQNSVRLIALNDNVDTIRGDDEFAPFRNIMNEWYARDTSKKVRAGYQAKNLQGKHTSSSVPYGYLKSEADKNQWVVDPVAAAVVKRIFNLTLEGKGPYQIASILSEDRVEIPAYYHKKLGIGLWQSREIKDPYHWGSSTIVHILSNPSYLGHTCNFKTRKHFKDKKSHYVEQDQWTIIENTHEAIIDQDTYDNVQRMRRNIRRYPDGWGEAHPLGGLLFCADCGGKMYVHRVNNGKRIPQFTCSEYSKTPVGTRCPTQHRINADVVLTLIRETLREIVRCSMEDEAAFERMVRETAENQRVSDDGDRSVKLAEDRKRLEDLELLICKIYEDNVLGKLPDSRYLFLKSQYEGEQAELRAEVQRLESAPAESSDRKLSPAKFIALVKKYRDFEELTTPMLIEFIDKILVHEREVKGRIDSPQTIEIYFNFIGKFDLPRDDTQPTPEEIELAEWKERIRQKRHQQYLRRKENGWQAAYYQKTRRAKKEAMDAANEAIRAEDRANGVYYQPFGRDASAQIGMKVCRQTTVFLVKCF